MNIRQNSSAEFDRRFGTFDEHDTTDLLNNRNVQKFQWGTRHTFALLCFIGTCLMYANRFNLSVAIVAMVRRNATVDISANDSSSGTCPVPVNAQNVTDSIHSGEFYWDDMAKFFVLGASFFGYFLFCVPGGRAADKFGGHLTMAVGTAVIGLMCVLSPLAARTSYKCFIVVRFVQGAAEGSISPSIKRLIVNWVTVKERSKYMAAIYSGIRIGSPMAMLISGLMSSSPEYGGWPASFYLFGSLSLLWSICWLFITRNSPQLHPKISQQELVYLKETIDASHDHASTIPWKGMFTSVPFISTLCVHLSFYMVEWLLLLEIPLYLNTVQHYTITKNSITAASPSLATFLFTLLYIWIIDRAIHKGQISIVNVRRVSMAIGGFIPSLALIALALVRCNRLAVLACLFIATLPLAAGYCAFICTPADIAPRHTGIMTGIACIFTGLAGFILSMYTGLVIQNNNDLGSWQIVFLTVAVFNIITTIFYLCTVTADIQHWNYDDDNYSSKIRLNE
uniref:Sialin-like n=1 Tax=Hirondellea gigas TaxID=1518452 RepID=A0A6A7G8W3_9CRUS